MAKLDGSALEKLFLVGISLGLVIGRSAGSDVIPVPVVNDPRLELTLFAAEPDIVTPIGLTVDAQNRIFVVESHTHMPPRDYPGPKSDWIKVFVDSNNDGKPDEIFVFAEGFKDAMNIALSPEGKLYVVCAREVWRLDGPGRDGASQGRTRVLELITQERYAHNSLLGITFCRDGWMYVSRGNTGGYPYTWRGSDGSEISGYGQGGDIVRARPDGSRVELVATGFWNLFDLKFDFAGRLLAVDNDPDSRGPNRLLHIVQDGDYGYKSLYGGSGLHPYLAWDGELPGTLPMIAGVGEAPSGLLDGTRAALPPDYAGDVLVTVWGEHTIPRYRLKPYGVSLTATFEIVIEGGQDFRPVAIDADRNGVIYITDWVKKDYPNHGHGRIWRLATKPGEEVLTPRPPFSVPEPNAAFEPFTSLMEANAAADYARLKQALTEEDPFLVHAAVTALARPVFRGRLLEDIQGTNAKVRLGSLLALRRANHPDPAPLLKRLLADPDDDVRRMALIWTGESGLQSLGSWVEKALTAGPVSPALLEIYLATLQNLTPEIVEAYEKKVRGSAIARRIDPRLVESIVREESRPAELRGLALARMDAAALDRNFRLLSGLVHDEEPRLRIEAVRSLAAGSHSEAPGLLGSVALDPGNPSELRAEAILSLSFQASGAVKNLLPLLDDPDEAVRIETVRALRHSAQEAAVRAALLKTLGQARESAGADALIEQLEFALYPAGFEALPGETPRFKRPSDSDEWEQAVADGGDPLSGRRVFYSATASCSQCHTVHGRGGVMGPDLSTIGRAAGRNQLIQSILRPSDDVSPAYQGWTIETTDGEIHSGLQLHHKSGGAIDLITLDGVTVRFPADRIVSYAAMRASLMPEGLENAMTVQDFRDLLAFMESLR